MHNAESRKLSYKIANGVIMFIMILLMLITIYPLYYTICASFSDARALLRNNDLLLKPLEPFTLDGYKAVFSNPSIVKSFGNTVFYVVVGTAISMALTIAGAFVVSRSYFLPRNVMMKGMLFTMFFGGGLIPWFFVVRDLGMYNTRWAIVIPAALSTYNLIIMRSFFPRRWRRARCSTARTTSRCSRTSYCPCPRRFWRSSACTTRSASGTAGITR